MGDDVVGHADDERTVQLPLARGDLGLEAIERAKKIACRLEHRLAVLGQAEAAAAALTEPEAQPGFKIVHMGADGRLGDVEKRLRRGEAAAFDNRREHPQKPQIRIAHPSQHRYLHTAARASFCYRARFTSTDFNV